MYSRLNLIKNVYFFTNRTQSVRHIETSTTYTSGFQTAEHQFNDLPLIKHPELRYIPLMQPFKILELLRHAVKTGNSSLSIWGPATERLILTITSLTSSQVFEILELFSEMGLTDKELLAAATVPLLRELKRIKPDHLARILQIYDEAEIRPEKLFTRILETLENNADIMYGNELMTVLRILATIQLANEQLLSGIAKSIIKGISRFSFNELTLSTAAFRSLGVQSQSLYAIIDNRMNLEAQMMTVQELLNNFEFIKLLEFSWKPYEDLLQKELELRLSQFVTARDVEELAHPIETMHMLKQKSLLNVPFLHALCDWCKYATKLTVPRVTADELLSVYHQVKELGMDSDPNLDEAIRFSVTYGCPEGSTGPLKFKARRPYIHLNDPFKACNLKIEPLPIKGRQFKQIHAKMAAGEIPEVPPGLVVEGPIGGKFMKAPHIGALWNATVIRPRLKTKPNRLIRFCTKNPLPKLPQNTKVPGYKTLPCKPIRHPRGWL